jgi:hypothetical protein
MRRIIELVAAAGAVLAAASAPGAAQSVLLDLPDVSQHARVMQRIGITNITIDFHRPLARGRKIFGGVQPYGAVWRAGANFNTIFEVTDSVSIEGRPLPKGAYGVHFIPGETSWVLILSKNSTSWGSFTYDEAEDALRVTVKPRTIDHQEALSYDFDSLTPTSAVVTMRWEKVAVPFTIRVNTAQVVARSFRNQLRGLVQREWQGWNEAANYLLENNLDANEALKYTDQSISVEDRFENEIVKARALGALGRASEAATTQKKALDMGTQQQGHSFARNLQALGYQNQALEIFRVNIAKDTSSWIARSEISRLAVAKGDFDGAIREMKLAARLAPAALRSQVEAFVRALENRVDINK